eukprot:TRINITY_DN29657_c0_g1_i1.p1 TRINITY_DN29657_c0_g1~~TRINITY_DN29657_c0_g1_i1.p1  ORF type:complete len:425 (-),score=48.46 TRINITY_DN29657_c0_g1_i1:247-1521(-)
MHAPSVTRPLQRSLVRDRNFLRRMLLLTVSGVSGVVSARLMWLWYKLRKEPTAAVYFSTGASRIATIMRSRASLHSPSYVPPLWATSKWLNLLAFMIKQRLFSDFKLRRETITLDDGGTVSIDWANDETTAALPENAPIVICLHTVTGSGKSTVDYLRYAASKGWRSCVFNRRGHDQRLTTARFNVMGTVSDSSRQMDAVKKAWPNADFVGMIGISAGSGHLITYLGSEGTQCQVDAAASLCPAYSIDTAFQNLACQYPLVDKNILEDMKRTWLPDVAELLQKEREEVGEAATLAREKALKDCWEACDLHDFLYKSWPFAPRERSHESVDLQNIDEYMTLHNPMSWKDSLTIPVLLVNSEDDMVCLKENIPVDECQKSPLTALILTRFGTHIAYQETLVGTAPSYLHRVTFEFLDAARDVKLSA